MSCHRRFHRMRLDRSFPSRRQSRGLQQRSHHCAAGAARTDGGGTNFWKYVSPPDPGGYKGGASGSPFMRISKEYGGARRRYVIAMAAMSAGHLALAQLTLTGSSYAQNFDAIGSGLPTGWSVRSSASAISLGNLA